MMIRTIYVKRIIQAKLDHVQISYPQMLKSDFGFLYSNPLLQIPRKNLPEISAPFYSII